MFFFMLAVASVNEVDKAYKGKVFSIQAPKKSFDAVTLVATAFNPTDN